MGTLHLTLLLKILAFCEKLARNNQIYFDARESPVDYSPVKHQNLSGDLHNYKNFLSPRVAEFLYREARGESVKN